MQTSNKVFLKKERKRRKEDKDGIIRRYIKIWIKIWIKMEREGEDKRREVKNEWKKEKME